MNELAHVGAAPVLPPLEHAKELIARARAEGDTDTLHKLAVVGDMGQRYFLAREAREDALRAGEIWFRAMSAMGGLLATERPHGGPREQGNSSVTLLDNPIAGLRRTDAAAWRKYGTKRADRVDDLMDAAHDDDMAAGITLAGVERLWKMIVDGVHYSSLTAEWATPQDLFDKLDVEFHFEVDVCATAENAKCKRYFTANDNGLAQSWTGTCWMNPPYGDVIGDWIRKAHDSAETGATVVCLVPARTDTGWFWDHARHGEVRFLRGRLKFGNSETSAPFPSCIVVFGRKACVKWWERVDA